MYLFNFLKISSVECCCVLAYYYCISNNIIREYKTPHTPKNEFEPQYEHSITKAVNRLQFSIFQILKIILEIGLSIN